jgi:hypothetical protein
MGYSLVKTSKVIDVETIDEAKRQALADRLKQTVALSELESSLSSLRSRVGVQVKKDAFEKKSTP